ncbi:MAG TPA: heme exporter protein CcmB [Fimbriimonadaceae bacterium]|nr:heme exporter protein CcmB [Fimbriimonadaceae bacterium]HRJ95510.1 heme exporter protein CcmB [Fimbriimonadaceae bacterium]
MKEVAAVFQKEWRAEVRSRHGLFTAGLFSVLAVVAMSFAGYGLRPSGSLAAGMLCVTLLFSAILALPRTFLIEDEQGTFDLLRLIGEPGPVFVGKTLYNIVQMLVTGALLGTVFLALSGVEVRSGPLLVAGLGLQCVALAAAVSLCGALVIGASNRWVLAGAVAMPLLLPQVFLGVGALRVALGEGMSAGGWQSVAGLAGFAVAALASGPLIASAVWREE